jgi:hypothetical protein
MADDFGIPEGNKHESDNRQLSCSSPMSLAKDNFNG